MSRRFCSVMGDSAEFQWIASQPLWKLIVDNIEDVHLFYMEYVSFPTVDYWILTSRKQCSQDVEQPIRGQLRYT